LVQFSFLIGQFVENSLGDGNPIQRVFVHLGVIARQILIEHGPLHGMNSSHEFCASPVRFDRARNAGALQNRRREVVVDLAQDPNEGIHLAMSITAN
jgi:hypothetical protein